MYEYVCVCMCECVHVYITTYEYADARGQPWLLSLCPAFCMISGDRPQALGSASWTLALLAERLPRSHLNIWKKLANKLIGFVMASLYTLSCWSSLPSFSSWPGTGLLPSIAPLLISHVLCIPFPHLRSIYLSLGSPSYFLTSTYTHIYTCIYI